MKRSAITALYKSPLLLISLSLGSVCFAQLSDAADLKKKFSSYQEQALQEKVYVHIDKSFYIAGETIWLKSYQVEAASNTPIDLSKVVYVEILDQQNKPVLQTKLSAKEGKADGSLDIPTSLASGVYTLRAYTSWMQNFDAAFFFHKSITVVNTFKRPDWKALENTPKLSLEIFPEGGNLVYGLKNTVAFKLTNAYNKGVTCNGYLLNATKDTLTKFESYRFGMGSFEFIPEATKSYELVVKTNEGEIVSRRIDSIYDKGYVLQVASTGDKVNVEIQSNKNNSEPLYCLVHTRGNIKFAEASRLNNGTTRFSLDKNLLGDGISHLTVFNMDRQPVCERLLFKTPTKQLITEIKTDKPQYNTRDKVDLSLQVKNQAANTNVSLAVFHLDSLQKPDRENIATYLWFTSDLGPQVEAAEYYMAHPEDEKAMDLLLLTKGWRRFNWNDVLDKKPVFHFLPEYEGHLVRTKFFDKQSGQPVTGINSYLSVAGKNFQLTHAKTDVNGISSFLMKDAAADQSIIVQAGDSLNFRAEILSPFSPQYLPTHLPDFDLPEHFKSDLKFASQTMQVQNVFGSLPSFQRQLPDSTHFYGKPYKTYFLDDFTRFPTMEEVLREYVAEVRLRKQKNSFSYNVLNATFKTFFDLPPLVLVDGVPFFNPDKVMTLDPLAVQKIEVVASKYDYGSSIHSGIISYLTYKGDIGGLPLDPNAIAIEYEGLQQKREFFAPGYQTEALKASRLPDFRNLLYWSPNIVTNKNGEAKLSFYTGDIKGKYLIVLQGLSDDGSTTYSSSTLTVSP